MDVPQDEDADGLAAALKSFGHPKRLRLLRLLLTPRSAESVANDLGIARQSAQDHLDQLTALGIVGRSLGEGERGPVTLYVTQVQRVFEIYDLLGERVGVLANELDEEVQPSYRTREDRLPRGLSSMPDQPRFTIVHGMRIGQTTPVEGGGPWLLGRDPQATLCVDYDPFASTRHAELRRAGGGFELADTFSSNGTFVDWRRLPRGGTAKLDNGSLVRIGKTLALFRTR